MSVGLLTLCVAHYIASPLIGMMLHAEGNKSEGGILRKWEWQG